jgi:prepilin-type N-terminal cleavage/methylation domain-containing protein
MRSGTPRHHATGFTLLELVLVIALLCALAGYVMPSFMSSLHAEALPTSARDLRSLIYLVRAEAMLEGKRYRIRFPDPQELEDVYGEEYLRFRHQPLIEKEDLPIEAPGLFVPVRANWAREPVLHERVRCIRLEPGMPHIEEESEEFAETLEGEWDLDADMQDMEELWNTDLIVEPDGTVEWATFTLVVLDDPQVELEDVEDVAELPKLNVMIDGRTGQIWVQRPLTQDEKELLLRENGSHILHMDRIDAEPITEENILRLKDLL